MPAETGEFGPRWLGGRLAALLPEFPRVRLCVAFSGGPDSTALLAALARVRPRPQALRALHVDHGLHPDSGDWSARAVRLARALGVPCEALAAQVSRAGGASLEARAREARYRLLAARLAPGEVLLSAHHQDDQLETVLLQLLRGAGVAGVAAMPELAPFAPGWLARPLLTRSRAELLAWVRAQRLECLEDPSNSDDRFDRNYLRLRVLPAIRARWPGAAATVSRTARHAAEAQRLLETAALADLARARHGAALAASALRSLPPERRRNALRFWIAARGLPVPPSRRLEEIAGPLLAARADAQPLVAWPGARLRRTGELLVLAGADGGRAAPAAAARARGAAGGIRWRWRAQPVCELPEGCGRLELRADAHGPVDLAALPATLTIRWRRGGERLTPLAGGARRALKSLLQEARVPAAERGLLPLIYGHGALVAVADRWLDQSVQARAGARRRARLQWQRTHDA
ncbi:MAG TPA: tRNA lysidine(34) synthetase TilS [Steroidobacteraceae bacterium]|nr:tRNA lysidine(34) synthetase TilS [Steroidobacteraceae bacterium]